MGQTGPFLSLSSLSLCFLGASVGRRSWNLCCWAKGSCGVSEFSWYFLYTFVWSTFLYTYMCVLPSRLDALEPQLIYNPKCLARRFIHRRHCENIRGLMNIQIHKLICKYENPRFLPLPSICFSLCICTSYWLMAASVTHLLKPEIWLSFFFCYTPLSIHQQLVTPLYF